MEKVNETGKPYGMEMNLVKTKAMVISKQIQAPKVNIMIQGRSIEQVPEMVYLGSLLTYNGKCEKEIRRGIGMARIAFAKLKTVLVSRNIKMCTRIKLIKCYVWSTLLYGCETWTLSKTSIKKIEALEMWTLRRLLKIPWTGYITNEEVLQLAGTERSLAKLVKVRNLKYFVHIVREQSWQRSFMEGKMNGKRGRGRPRRKWTDDIKNWTEKNYYQCVRMTLDSKNWHSLIFHLLRAEETVD